MDPLRDDTQPSAGEILIIDDEPIVRDALARVIDELRLGVAVVEVASVPAAAQVLADRPAVRLAIVDIAIPGAGGLGAVARLLGVRPALPTLVLSSLDDPSTARGALEAGARGFISKRSPVAVLVEVIRLLLVGGTYVPPHAVGARAPGGIPNAGAARVESAPRRDETPVLTARQQDVLALMLQGRPNKLICRTLNLCEGTVKTHVANIFRVLGVSNRTEAAYAVRRLGLRLREPDECMVGFSPRSALGLSMVV